jgi:hypothetical protein
VADDQAQPQKPYIRNTGKDPQGIPYAYKDISKQLALTEDQLDAVITSTSVVQQTIATEVPRSTINPLPIGIAAPGIALPVSREDHVHGTPMTTKGDIMSMNATPALVRQGVGADGQVLVADASQTSGLHWLALYAGFFGNGADGSSTLGSNTTLAGNLSLSRNYTTLTLSTFTLKANGGSGLDTASVYCCSVLLTGSGGSILPCRNADTTGGVGHTLTSGASGTGGSVRGATTGIFVFARKTSGTVLINGNGANGDNGGNASGTPSGGSPTQGGNGSISSLETYFLAANTASGTPGTPIGGLGAGSGQGGAGGAVQNFAENNINYNDSLRFFIGIRTAPCDSNSGAGSRYLRIVRTPGGSAGAGGGASSTTAQSTGGGGGGSCAMANTAGSTGGTGGQGGGTIGYGGGGAASGTPGTFVGVVVGEVAASSTLTVSSNGGAGGTGGNATNNGGGGGGGAGAPGGIIHALMPVNYNNDATVTFTVTGGSLGTGGAGAGSGAGGTNGVVGNAGTTNIVTWFN